MSKSEKPLILITNDDGINAPGIYHLWKAAKEVADVAIIAPNRERSGSAVSITWTKPITIESVRWEEGTNAWSISGTPADCVKMGVSYLLKERPTLVVSGVNRGSNAGRTLYYSGTVGGVIDGVLRGIPGIAFSYGNMEIPPIDFAQSYIKAIIEQTLAQGLPRGTFLNVTFPETEEIRGFRIAKQGQGYYLENPEMRTHPQGSPYFWLGGQWRSAEEDPESDVSLLEQGYVTAAPITIADLTDEQTRQTYKTLEEKIFTLAKNRSMA
jgi:5'-nucleotidase